MKKLDHPNIIKLYEILHNYQKQKIYLILEYADYGDIVDYDEESEIFSINKHVEERYSVVNNQSSESIEITDPDFS